MSRIFSFLAAIALMAGPAMADNTWSMNYHNDWRVAPMQHDLMHKPTPSQKEDLWNMVGPREPHVYVPRHTSNHTCPCPDYGSHGKKDHGDRRHRSGKRHATNVKVHHHHHHHHRHQTYRTQAPWTFVAGSGGLVTREGMYSLQSCLQAVETFSFEMRNPRWSARAPEAYCRNNATGQIAK